jgi:hypothetical protein
MSEYFDKSIENVEPTIYYDDNGWHWLCIEIETNHKNQLGLPVSVHLTKAELRKVLEQLEAL